MLTSRISSAACASPSTAVRASPAFARAGTRSMHRSVKLQVAQNPPASTSDNYAVIEMGGYQQWVEEGAVLAADKYVLEEIALGNTVQFKKVIAMKHDGSLNLGKPYLSDVTVEGILEDEFRGPSCSMLASGDQDSGSDDGQVASRSFSDELTLRRVRVTKIRSSEK